MKPKGSNPEKTTLSFSKAEALVLFEFLFRFSEQKNLQIRDPAEQRVLWDMLAQLERELVEPFSKDYQLLLQNAQNEIRDKP